jgi:hypothetical protein
MCDYSIKAEKSRPAKVADKLTTHRFVGGSVGFCAGGDTDTAVCVLPGTEIAFEDNIVFGYNDVNDSNLSCWNDKRIGHKTAIFRQDHKDQERMHHDYIELPDGSRHTLSSLAPGQNATVLQLPATPKTEAEVEKQRRAEYVG